MSRIALLALLVIAATATAAAPAAAQARFEVGAGGTWTGGFDAGGRDAQLSTNPGTNAAPLTLFETSATFDPAPGAVVRAALFFRRRFAVEAAVHYSRSHLRVPIANDFESATGTEASTTISSYGFGGSLLYYLGARRVRPFAIAGASRMRQLDDGNLDLVSATELHAGGGVTVGLADHLALRADAVASSRDKSIDFSGLRHIVPLVTIGLTYRF
jgi:outer membrane protein with beta-barrel domain